MTKTDDWLWWGWWSHRCTTSAAATLSAFLSDWLSGWVIGSCCFAGRSIRTTKVKWTCPSCKNGSHRKKNVSKWSERRWWWRWWWRNGSEWGAVSIWGSRRSVVFGWLCVCGYNSTKLVSVPTVNAYYTFLSFFFCFLNWRLLLGISIEAWKQRHCQIWCWKRLYLFI